MVAQFDFSTDQMQRHFILCIKKRDGCGGPDMYYTNGKGVTFESYNPRAAMVFVEKDDINNAEKFSYRLYNSHAKAAIDVFETFRPSRILLWAADHIVSVETFHESNQIQPN